MIYFISDLHFCHSNIIRMCNRPFNNIDEMNAALIANWNAVISRQDEVYILGDFLFKGNGDQANQILQKLKGKKYLIKGNHEKYLNDPDFDASAFEWIKDYHVLSYKDAHFILFHYPIFEWEYYHRKSTHLYGHVHNNESHVQGVSGKFDILGERAINVGVDRNNFFPVSAETIYTQAFLNE